MLDRREFFQRSTLAAALFGLPQARAEPTELNAFSDAPDRALRG